MTTVGLKHIQDGDTVSVRGVVKGMTDENVLVMFKLKSGQKTIDWVSRDVVGAAYALPPAPKYDPCRLFKKGDKVRIVSRNNRHFNLETCRFHNKIATVDCNEKDLDPDTPLRLEVEGEYIYSDAAYLELITPVEELEPHFTKAGAACLWWDVWRREEEEEAVLVASFSIEHHPNPKAAAEAECASLNAKYRKEQK